MYLPSRTLGLIPLFSNLSIFCSCFSPESSASFYHKSFPCAIKRRQNSCLFPTDPSAPSPAGICRPHPPHPHSFSSYTNKRQKPCPQNFCRSCYHSVLCYLICSGIRSSHRSSASDHDPRCSCRCKDQHAIKDRGCIISGLRSILS